MAIWCDGVFNRYKGVLRLEVKVVWQAGPRKVWIRSARPCLPSPKRRVDVGIGDPAIQALLVGTGIPVGVHALGCSAAAFDLAPRGYRSWASTERGSGAESTGRTIVWGAGLEQTVERAVLGSSSRGGRPKREPVKTPKQRQREQGATHEQEHEHVKDHLHPRSLKWEAQRVP